LNRSIRVRKRRLGMAGLIASLVATAVPLLGAATPAAADIVTTSTVTASTGATPIAQTNVASGGTLSGLVDGETVTIHVAAPTAADLGGIVQARQCDTGVVITNSADMGPSNTGFCLDAPFAGSTGQSDVSNIAKASPSDTSLDFTFKVGTGTRSVAFDDGTSPPPNVITCNATSPSCTLWIEIARNGGSDFVHYDLAFLSAPDAPVATADPACAKVSWTPAAFTGNAALTTYTVEAVSGDGGVAPAPLTINEPTHTATFAGLTPFKSYTATVKATNAGGLTSVASSPVALVTAGCVGGPVQGDPTVAAPNVTINWSAPPVAGFDGFDIVLTPTSPAGPALAPIHVAAPATSKLVTGLSNGVVYSSVVTATYGASSSAPSNAKTFVIVNTALLKTITVVRPNGALVLTQVCAGGTAPKVDFGAGPVDDPLFPASDVNGGYPYPQDPTTGASLANYPSTCGINLGAGKLIKTGPGAGQFFTASAPLGDISIVDTRDVGTGSGWTVNGKMVDFVNLTGDTIDADELGWVPAKVSDTDGVTFSDGTTYDQTLVPGAAVLPNQANGTGLSNGKQLAFAAEGSRLGIAVANAGLTLWIPITARNGTYTGVLTITAI
jgi:hypothetical protein